MEQTPRPINQLFDEFAANARALQTHPQCPASVAEELEKMRLKLTAIFQPPAAQLAELELLEIAVAAMGTVRTLAEKYQFEHECEMLADRLTQLMRPTDAVDELRAMADFFIARQRGDLATAN